MSLSNEEAKRELILWRWCLGVDGVELEMVGRECDMKKFNQVWEWGMATPSRRTRFVKWAHERALQYARNGERRYPAMLALLDLSNAFADAGLTFTYTAVLAGCGNNITPTPPPRSHVSKVPKHAIPARPTMKKGNS